MTTRRLTLCGAAALIATPTALAQDCITTVWSEDVESFVDGQNIITGQACYPNCSPGLRWEAWESEPEGAGSTADAAFGNPGLSISISGERAIGSDNLVHTFHDLKLTSGTWLFSGDLYVPSGTRGRSLFTLMNRYVNDGLSTSENWSTQIQIDAQNWRVESDFDGGTAPLQFDVWRRLETVIDLDGDTQLRKYDGEILNEGFTYSWAGWGSGGVTSFVALDLEGDDTEPVYWDNFRLCSIPRGGACCFRSDPCIDDIERGDCESLHGSALFQGIGSVCGGCPFYGDDGWEIDDLGGTALPFQWVGNTCDDFPGIPSNPDCEFFPEDCSECDLSDALEQSWSFRIPWTGTWVFSTCRAADFDSQIFAGAATCTGDIGFNDDCARAPNETDSELALALTANERVAITLEGVGGDCGRYTLSVGSACPDIAIGPDEELLGPCVDGDTDPENRGCNTDPEDPMSIPTFTDIECGQTFAGTVGNFDPAHRVRRDFDWFRLDVAEASTLTLDAVGNFPQVILLLVELNPDPGSGEDECTNAGLILASDETPSCLEADGTRAAAQITFAVEPGLYAPVVTTAFVDPFLPPEIGGAPCGRPYELTVTCASCSETGDVSGDGVVNFADILVVLTNWGTAGPAGDANCDGSVTFQDLLVILEGWS